MQRYSSPRIFECHSRIYTGPKPNHHYTCRWPSILSSDYRIRYVFFYISLAINNFIQFLMTKCYNSKWPIRSCKILWHFECSPFWCWNYNISRKLRNQSHYYWYPDSLHHQAINNHVLTVYSRYVCLPQGRISTTCAMAMLENSRKYFNISPKKSNMTRTDVALTCFKPVVHWQVPVGDDLDQRPWKLHI